MNMTKTLITLAVFSSATLIAGQTVAGDGAVGDYSTRHNSDASEIRIDGSLGSGPFRAASGQDRETMLAVDGSIGDSHTFRKGNGGGRDHILLAFGFGIK